jgi:hypothetical protein
MVRAQVARSGKDSRGLTTNSVTIVTYNLMQQTDFATAVRYLLQCFLTVFESQHK